MNSTKIIQWIAVVFGIVYGFHLFREGFLGWFTSRAESSWDVITPAVVMTLLPLSVIGAMKPREAAWGIFLSAAVAAFGLLYTSYVLKESSGSYKEDIALFADILGPMVITGALLMFSGTRKKKARDVTQRPTGSNA